MAGIGMHEQDWEEHALEVLAEYGWETLRGPAVAPGSGQRASWEDPVLHGMLSSALRTLNPTVPPEYLDQAAAEVLTPTSQDAIAENHRLHQVLVHGYTGITYVDRDGEQQTPTIRFLSSDASRNTYHAVNQLTLRSRQAERRFDVVLYVNGLPLAVIELKNAGTKD